MSSGIWILTDIEESETVEVTRGGRSSEDVGGDFGAPAVQQSRKSLMQRVQISAADLKQQVGELLRVVGDVFDQAKAETGLPLDGVELSIEINSEGQVSLLGTGAKIGGRGGIKLTFKRNTATS